MSIEQANFINIENKKCKEGKKIINAYNAPKEDPKISFVRLVEWLANFPVKDNIM